MVKAVCTFVAVWALSQWFFDRSKSFDRRLRLSNESSDK